MKYPKQKVKILKQLRRNLKLGSSIFKGGPRNKILKFVKLFHSVHSKFEFLRLKLKAIYCSPLPPSLLSPRRPLFCRLLKVCTILFHFFVLIFGE